MSKPIETEGLIAPTMLFRFSLPCYRFKGEWTKEGFELTPKYSIPSFRAELQEGPRYGDFRMGWNEKGIFASVRVTGKKKSVWCRDSRLEDSDGLLIWIDTRDTHNIHRASRFCHQFAFLPQGAGRWLDQPVGKLIEINRARENPKMVADKFLHVRSEKRIDGYILQCHVPAAALTGFDLTEQRNLGFFYAIVDRELGWQTLSLSPDLPITNDPSLWGTIELVD